MTHENAHQINQDPYYKLPDVPEFFEKVNKIGQPVVLRHRYFDLNNHIQGIASKGDKLYISENVTPSIGVFSINEEKFIKSIHLDTKLTHYGGIQLYADTLAIGVETAGDPNPRSEIRFIDTGSQTEVKEMAIYREGRKAGAVGMTSYNKNGVEHFILAAYDNGTIDFYDGPTSQNPLRKFQEIPNTKHTLNNKGYASIALAVDKQQNIFLAGFWTDHFEITSEREDFIDLYQINPAKNFEPIMFKEKIHFVATISYGGLANYLGTHFRYAGGMEINERYFRILACSRGTDISFIVVNLFEYRVNDFSSKSCGKIVGEATSLEKLQPGGQVSINNSVDLSRCIVGHNKARVFSIALERIDSPYLGFKFQIKVIAEGPSGIISKPIYLFFTDDTNDTYSLSISDSSIKEHTVKYNSIKPEINTIEWRDYFN
ncbi:hypothetical protein ACFCVS_15805 [Bacillus altitudinis]|uniref:hypothetical protein n=1 Tax=Bacillus TaxID=1386 RepID=UPI000F78E59F|nr:MULTISPECIES: hypothetical protein [Bacillus]MDJ0287329.1 hypothetical protein [Bacillus altitudinis]QDZ95995.1 hypothetical protein D0438_13915 [Bacillus altitudinis]